MEKILKKFHQFLTSKIDFEIMILALLDEPSLVDGFKKKSPLSMLILDQKSCFLGTTIFEIPHPN